MKNRHLMSATAALIVFATYGSVSAAETKDPNIGTWKLNMKESRNTKGLPYKSGFTVIIRSGSPVLDYTFISDPGPDGKPHTFGFKAIPDGQVRPNGDDGSTYSMEILPQGVVDAKLWSKDGSLENKFCIMYKSLVKQICLATITTKDGKRTMFTNVLDKVSDAVN